MYGRRRVGGGYVDAGYAAHEGANDDNMPGSINHWSFHELTDCETRFDRDDEALFAHQSHVEVETGRSESTDAPRHRRSMMNVDHDNFYGDKDVIGDGTLRYPDRTMNGSHRRNVDDATACSNHNEEYTHSYHEHAPRTFEYNEDDPYEEVEGLTRSTRYNSNTSNTEDSYSTRRRRVQDLSFRLQDRLGLSGRENTLPRLRDTGGYGRYRVRGGYEYSDFDEMLAPWEGSREYEPQTEADTVNLEDVLARRREGYRQCSQ